MHQHVATDFEEQNNSKIKVTVRSFIEERARDAFSARKNSRCFSILGFPLFPSLIKIQSYVHSLILKTQSFFHSVRSDW